MDKNELWKLYWQKDKEFEAAKGKRTILSILLFAVGYFVVIYALSKQPSDWKIIGGILLASIFFAGIHFWINSFIFLYLFQKGREEAEILERIKKRIEQEQSSDGGSRGTQ